MALVADAVPERRYYSNNPAFGIGDASMLDGMLVLHRPSRIVEIGSGYSSALILDVVERHLPDTSVTFVEPYSELLRSLMREGDEARCEIVEQRAQDVLARAARRARAPATCCSSIRPTSCARAATSADLVLEVLPALRAGVVVHVHDIFWPFELPRDVGRGGPPVGRVLPAAGVPHGQPELADPAVQRLPRRYHRPFMERVLPRFLENTGGSLWLRRV